MSDEKLPLPEEDAKVVRRALEIINDYLSSWDRFSKAPLWGLWNEQHGRWLSLCGGVIAYRTQDEVRRNNIGFSGYVVKRLPVLTLHEVAAVLDRFVAPADREKILTALEQEKLR